MVLNMRTEQEMFDLIIRTAQNDERIRAVYMNGSRTNPNVSKDIFQDYDIVYVVLETGSFQQDEDWINRFGERLYMQYPENNVYFPSDKSTSYGWLIQFADGNRLDLHVETIAYTLEHILDDKLCKILLDKDGLLPEIPEATDRDYWVKKPTKEEYLCTCNEFWWCLNNVAKGLWREEIPYVQDMLNLYVRPELIKMLSFQIGIETNFSVSIGKCGKFMHRYLSHDVWNQFLHTYASYQIEELWKAVLIMCELFDNTARKIGEKLQYPYHEQEAIASRNFLKHVKALPKDAKEVF